MLENAFQRLCEAYAAKQQGFDGLLSRKGPALVFGLERRVILLELVFRRSALGQLQNTLYARVYPNKNEEIYYLPPELFLELGIEEYRSCFFGQIESEERLEACFSQLTKILEQWLGPVEAAAEAGEIPLSLEPEKRDTPERRALFGTNPELRDSAVLYSYTLDPAYRALLLGDGGKALGLLEKKKRKGKSWAFQDRLARYLESRGGDFSPMPDSCNAVRAEAELKRKFLPVYSAGFVLVFVAFSGGLILLRGLFLRFFTEGCAASFSAPWYTAFLLAGLPAMFGTIALRRPLARRISGKYGPALDRLDRVKNGWGTQALAAAAFTVSLVVTVMMFVRLYGETVRIYEDRLDYAAADSVLRREEIAFGEIEAVCHVRARYNVYGDRLERGSYVLVTGDGRRFDLDGSASEAQCEEILLPLLEPYRIPVTELDTIRDLDER